MASVSLTGLPENVKLQKLIYLFKSLLKRDGVNKFWIKEMAEIRGTDLKSATLEFDSYDDAMSGVRVLNGFPYSMGDSKYPLTARIDSSRPRRRSPSPMYRRERERYDSQRYDRYEEPRDRFRERSPLMQETSKLDLEIELLRKRRLIIEEERRLLLERKKLELVKEFGPNVLKDFKSMESGRGHRSPPPRRRSPPPLRAPRRPPGRAPAPAPAPRRPPGRPPFRPMANKLPQFNLPCKLLISEMQDLISKIASESESSFLVRLLCTTLRKRIAILLEDKPILPGAKIVAIYRQKYPATTDEVLIKKHMKEVKACHLRKSPAEPRKEGARKEAKEKSETNTKPTADAANGNEMNEALDAGDARMETSAETEEQDHRVETCSLGSSEALALHDKNDEDWVQGEHGWDADDQAQAAH